ncbi:helix-turn-helix domain-containing protein [Mucilaginibacter sp. BJC16-A38]|uniref:helix-turn-helix transcriptional regulator n=1 Tax=Mucilaginibacter phenanthrenivorans TaxID=1234842 RepID=UPI00358E6645|nr:helix-turn-helix domain-containing protein [Mucilaginibacter phenanthrenivorans]
MKIPIGHILKFLRKKNNLSQNIIAEYLVVSRQTYVRYELNIVELTVSQIFLIGSFYNLDIKELIFIIEKRDDIRNFHHLDQMLKNYTLTMEKSV